MNWTAETVNAAQRDFWNDASGQKWVVHQEVLDALMAPVADLVVDCAAPCPGERVLDIGCGAGATTQLAARLVAPGGAVAGLDISEPLAALARERIAAAGLGNAVIEVADAQVIAAPEARFDVAISRFGVMFFEDPAAAFRNIAGLIKPGGRLVFAAWAAIEHNPWFSLPLGAAVARLGPATPGDPDGPGPMAFRDRARVTAILEAAGFTAVRSREVDLGLPVAGGAAAAADLARYVGPIARHLRDTGGDAEDLAAILETLRAAFAPFDGPEGSRIPARINLFEARTPSPTD